MVSVVVGNVHLCDLSCNMFFLYHCELATNVSKSRESVKITVLKRVLTADQFLFFRFSYSNLIGEEQLSEFWNHDDEASGSGEDISDSDGKSVA